MDSNLIGALQFFGGFFLIACEVIFGAFVIIVWALCLFWMAHALYKLYEKWTGK